LEGVLSNKSCTCGDERLLKDKAFLLEMLEKLMIIRKFEEKVFELFMGGLLHGTIHLGIGEEATGAGTAMALAPGDYVFVTHRGHCQAIGKGCDVNGMMAEIMGRQSGVCSGRGGSMHIADFDNGVLGSNGIVGANAPLACGAALTIKLKGIPDRISVAFFGDGASNQGAVHEAMNFAASRDLPVLFCLVNNKYGVSTALANAVKETDLTKRAAAYGMKSFECDGNDVLAVYETTREARRYVLENGPCLLLEHTYRTSGHSKSDRNLYRSKEEIAAWEAVNPVARFSNFLLERGLFTQDEINAADKSTTDIIDEATEYSLAAQNPSVEGVLDNVFA
jgi:pyruvate dehydrogenase E1 component alpha subunit